MTDAPSGARSARPGLRLRSLRLRAILLATVVGLSPLLFVGLSDLSDRGVGSAMERRVAWVADEAAQASEDLRPQRMDDLARTKRVRLQVVHTDGRVDVYDHEAATDLVSAVGALFFGPDGAPSLQTWDAEQLPPPARPLVETARSAGHAAACQAVDDRRLLVCEAAVRAGDDVVLVQESSRRAIRALYDQRYQLAKLTFFSGALGVGLGAFLGWRMVRPVERLRAQVLERAAGGTTTPVRLERDDELGDLAIAFNTLLAALEARRRANEAFATDLVHELKNPVAAVRTAAELLDTPTAGPIPRDRDARIATLLRDAGRRLDALVSQFLELARAEAGLPDMPREPVDMRALVDGLTEVLHAHTQHIHVSVEGDGQVTAAPERLETALRNLLENAFTHGSVGPSPRIAIHIAATQGQVTIAISDNGPGIDEADLPRIFDRFYTRQRQGGTGLGLPLARAIIEAHGGVVTVENRPDGGARFVVQLPALPPAASPAGVSRSTAPA